MFRLGTPAERWAILHLALALGLIDAERVRLDLGVARMGKARLRRHRYWDFVGGDQDRLSELAVPGAVLLLDALERSKLQYSRGLGAVRESHVPMLARVLDQRKAAFLGRLSMETSFATLVSLWFLPSSGVIACARNSSTVS